MQKTRNRNILGGTGVIAVLLVIVGLAAIAPSYRVLAQGANAACDGKNLIISWDNLFGNAVSVVVNGAEVVQNGPDNGNYTVVGPGDWAVQVKLQGSLIEEFHISCPVDTPPLAAPPPVDPNRFPTGNLAAIDVVFKQADGGHDLYMYDPKLKVGTLAFRMTCADETRVARQSLLRILAKQNPNVPLYGGVDPAGHPVTVYFIYPNQLLVTSYFADGKPLSYLVPVCVAASAVNLNPTLTPTLTPTATVRPPNISLSASCTIRGNATYRITNNGGDMQSAGNWVVTRNGTQVGSDIFKVRAGGVTTITSSGVYGDITFSTSGGGTTSQSVTTHCQSPTATPTRTPTLTPRPPIISLSASCTIRGNATYRITNNGGDMQSAGNWVVIRNGTQIGSDIFKVRAGGVTTITSSGIYGNITFSTSGGGTTPQSVTTFCQSPTATPTRTPTRPPK